MISISQAQLLVCSLGLLSVAAAHTRPGSEAVMERIAINDNRVPGGTLRDGVLSLRLEAREGEWHPDADSGRGVTVRAFGEEGHALQIPGPMIRVVEGTEIRLSFRNGLEKSLTLHGLNERPAPVAGRDTFTVGPGETHEVRFVAATPGTYYYWGATAPNTRLGARIAMDTELSGMLIVDSKDTPRRPERVMLISFWETFIRNDTGGVLVKRVTINGKSWPNTERLTYDLGDSVRIRVANVGTGAHPMHLHGFYYRVDSRGDAQVDTVFPPGSTPRWAVTERISSGRTFSLTWVPRRAGNWLFHCHDPVHVDPNIPLDGKPVAQPTGSLEAMSDAMNDMGGPVIGITVREPRNPPPTADSRARRQLRLVARLAPGSSAAHPFFGYSLGDDTAAMRPGPVIILRRGEPVAITVVNRLKQPTSVHWHGIELDSYYDGVPGFAGHESHIAPEITPNDSFVARFTPPRSGTFIYHPHVNETRQQEAGLAGALIVVDDPARWDSTHDLIMFMADPRGNPIADTVFLNGSSAPAPRDLRVGDSYRFRLINMHSSRPGLILKIMRDSTVLTWRAMAKDGMTLPPDLATVRRSAQQIGNGETYDFEFLPTQAGDLHVDVTSNLGVLLARTQLRVH